MTPSQAAQEKPTSPRTHATLTVAALEAAGFSDDDMVRFLDAVEASGLTLIPREAAAATPSLDSLEQAAQIAEQHAERIKHTSHRDGLGMGWWAGEELCRQIAARIRSARLDEGSATPDQGKGEPR